MIPKSLMTCLFLLLAFALPACGKASEKDAGEAKKKSEITNEEVDGTAKTAMASSEPANPAAEAAPPGDQEVPKKVDLVKPQEAPPPQPVEMAPLVFDPPLPTTPIAHVNGQPVPAKDLLINVLNQNFSQGVQNLMIGAILDMELAKSNTTVSEDEINSEIEALLEKSAPGSSLEDLQANGSISIKHLRNTARTQRGWKKLFWEANKIPEDQRHEQTNQLMMQFFMRQKMGSYTTRIRGANPAPPEGTLAQVVDKTNGNEVVITASEALDFLVGLAKEGGLVSGRDQLIKKTVIDQAMAKADVTVGESEVATWAAEMRQKHTPPFNWEQICKIKGTSPEREMERWRSIQAWKRITKEETNEADVEKFLEKHKSFFRGKTKKFSHILVRTTDGLSDRSIGTEAEAEAHTKIDLIHDKVVEGVDFAWLAKTYSEDTVTQKGEGRIATPVKEFGGGMDPAFHKAAWKLEKVGDVSEPVKSRFGWHVIKLDEVNEPTSAEQNWKDPRFWEWIVDEYNTQKMEAYVEGLMSDAKVELAPASVVLDLKERSYFDDSKKAKTPDKEPTPPNKDDR